MRTPSLSIPSADRLPLPGSAERVRLGFERIADGPAILQKLADAPDGRALLAAVGGYEAQMREYGYAEVLASQRAEAEMGARRSVAFWLYRRLARSGRGERPG